MRITNQYTTKNSIYNYQKDSQSVNKLAQQLSQKIKIQHSYEDSRLYNDATRLNYEITLLDQVQETTTKATEFTKNSDTSLGSFVDLLTTFRTKLVQAANEGSQNSSSRQAIANDLEGLRSNMMDIANTAINGQYLFSGTALDTKPISSDGAYHGNAEAISAVTGADQQTKYNIDGFNLFLGRDNDYNKVITTNVSIYNDREKLLDSDSKQYISTTDRIYDIIGQSYRTSAATAEYGQYDYDSDFEPSNPANFPASVFFIQGRDASGETFSAKFELTPDSNVQKILDNIGKALGNTDANQIVKVDLNASGQIEVTDLDSGNLLGDFSFFALTPQQGSSTETGMLTQAQVEALTDLDTIKTAVANGKVHLTEFVSSPKLSLMDSASTTGRSDSTAMDYDSLLFEKTNNILKGNMEQVVRKSGEYATDATKLVDVAGSNLVDANGNRIVVNGKFIEPDLTVTYDKNGVASPSTANLTMDVKSRDGNTYNVRIDFVGSGADQYPTVTINDVTSGTATQVYEGNVYTGKYNAFTKQTEGVKVAANDITYREVADIITIVAAGNFQTTLPSANINTTSVTDITNYYNDFNNTLRNASVYVEAGLDYHGRMQITDKVSSNTKIEFAMYQDNGANDYPSGLGFNNASNGSLFSFNGNDAVTIDDASVDIFKDLEDMIEAVRGGIYRADYSQGDSRSTGVQGALKRIDHILDHIDKQQAIAGTYTNTLTEINTRASVLEVNISSIKSDMLDVDYGETIIQFQQSLLGYQAMLQTTAKISQISLLQYM